MSAPPDGSIVITITKKKDDEIIVSIRDADTGIHHEILSKIFTKFTTKSTAGTGLGLFISKSILEDRGEKIWAENNIDNAGATISFSLPISQDIKNK